MSIIKTGDRTYEASGIEGISQCGLWDNGMGGGTALVRLAANSYFPAHNHPGWEQALMLSGKLRLGDDILQGWRYTRCNSYRGLRTLCDDRKGRGNTRIN